MRKTGWIVVLTAILGSCGGGGGAGESATSAVADYLATASVGDFLQISIDHDAKTITYQNNTNGLAGTVAYTIEADGSYAINDPLGHLITGYELPGYALVLEVANAGPNQDTHCLAFAINKAPIDPQVLDSGSYNYMQFRVKDGGMEIGNTKFSPGSMQTESFFPLANKYGGQSAFISHSWDTSTWILDASGFFFTVMEPGGDEVNTIFATPSGVRAVDTPHGNIIAFKQAATKNLLPEHVGSYKAIVYGKDVTAKVNEQEVGTAWLDKGTITIAPDGHLTVQNDAGQVVKESDLEPVADKEYLVGNGKLQDTCNGLFTFRVTENGMDTDVFVAFIDGAVLFCSFHPESGDKYMYFYGVGLKM